MVAVSKTRKRLWRRFLFKPIGSLLVKAPGLLKSDPRLEALASIFEQLDELWKLNEDPEIFERLLRTLKVRSKKELMLVQMRRILKFPGNQHNPEIHLLEIMRRVKELEQELDVPE